MSEEHPLLQLVAALAVIGAGTIGATVWTQERLTGTVAMRLERLTDSVEANRYRIDRQTEQLDALQTQVIGVHNLRRVARIQAAMRQIDPDDPSQVTTTGRPRVEALEEILREQSWSDWRISAHERDLACFLDTDCEVR